jgi:hypothetical protein
LTLLAPSERSNQQSGRRHKLLTDWARQGALQLCRWLRLDASLFAPPVKRTSRTVGRPAQKGPTLPNLKILLSNPATIWTRIIVSAWYGQLDGKTL